MFTIKRESIAFDLEESLDDFDTSFSMTSIEDKQEIQEPLIIVKPPEAVAQEPLEEIPHIRVLTINNVKFDPNKIYTIVDIPPDKWHDRFHEFFM